MTTRIPTPVLTDDHIDLLISAAVRWDVLTSRTRAAFSSSTAEQGMLIATATEAGRLLRAENAAAVEWLATQGRSRLTDRVQSQTYTHHPVEHLRPVEVIKAAHAVQSICSPSPTWQGSVAQQLVGKVITAATYRLDGYADAPWYWTRPHLRPGASIGVGVGDDHPQIAGLDWFDPSCLGSSWTTAPLVIITPAAALDLPPDMEPRPGVFVLVREEHPNAVWEALLALDMQALVLFWPASRAWLLHQLSDPAPEFAEHREAS